MSLVIDLAPTGPRLTGELDPAGVEQALAASRSWLVAGSDPLRIDLGGVTRSESAGIALLLEWQRRAASQGRRIEFAGMPAQMLTMLKFFGLERVLPVHT